MTDYLYASIPLVVFIISVYFKVRKAKSSEKQIDIILESLPEAKDKVKLLIKDGKRNAEKSDS